MTFYKWSQIAAADATADASINWQEGQAPSSINDSARAMMAAMAKYRDDVAGAVVTSGTSTAYAVSSFQAFDSLARLNGQTIAFTPHATNGATVTLNVDGLGAKPLRSAPGNDLLAGMLVQGTPYTCTYSNADAAFYLRDFHVSPYVIPIGSSVDYWGSAAPNSAFALAYGQAISRTTYASLFALFSTTYGSGDGSSTFNIPDLRGRVTAGKDDMGGSAASRLTTTNGGVDGGTLGAFGGAQNVTLAANQIPSLSSTGTNNISVSGTALNTSTDVGSLTSGGPGNFGFATARSASTIVSTGSNSISVTYSPTPSQQITKLVQPTIICNKLIRLI